MNKHFFASLKNLALGLILVISGSFLLVAEGMEKLPFALIALVTLVFLAGYDSLSGLISALEIRVTQIGDTCATQIEELRGGLRSVELQVQEQQRELHDLRSLILRQNLEDLPEPVVVTKGAAKHFPLMQALLALLILVDTGALVYYYSQPINQAAQLVAERVASPVSFPVPVVTIATDAPELPIPAAVVEAETANGQLKYCSGALCMSEQVTFPNQTISSAAVQ